jgi:hypothetical protein
VGASAGEEEDSGMKTYRPVQIRMGNKQGRGDKGGARRRWDDAGEPEAGGGAGPARRPGASEAVGGREGGGFSSQVTTHLAYPSEPSESNPMAVIHLSQLLKGTKMRKKKLVHLFSPSRASASPRVRPTLGRAFTPQHARLPLTSRVRPHLPRPLAPATTLPNPNRHRRPLSSRYRRRPSSTFYHPSSCHFYPTTVSPPPGTRRPADRASSRGSSHGSSSTTPCAATSSCGHTGSTSATLCIATTCLAATLAPHQLRRASPRRRLLVASRRPFISTSFPN